MPTKKGDRNTVLVTFRSKSYADITMFGEVGVALLKLMDYGVTVPGGIVSADVGKALKNLQQGLLEIPEEVEPEEDEDDEPPRINLPTRALPLIELLQAAYADENDVRWE